MKHDGLVFHLDQVDRMRMSYGMPPAWLPVLPAFPISSPEEPISAQRERGEERAR